MDFNSYIARLMKLPFIGIFIILLNLNSFTSSAQNGRIEGRIFDEKNNEPLAFTNIIIFGTTIGTTSDLNGKFIFTGLEPGYVKLMASSVGYQKKVTEDILITNAKTSFIDIPMQEASYAVGEVKITANSFVKKKESPVSLRNIEISEIEKNPGGNRDISKVIQSFPGVASTPAYRNDVIVRGGGSSENRFYLDGIEIPNINHFATQGASGGPAGIINVDFIREVDFYSSAFPASRGNALSSILELRQIDGNKDRVRFRGSVGATDFAFTANGPLNEKSTFILSARQSYLQFLFAAIGLPFLPTYNDFQFKSKIEFDEKNQLTIIGLGAIDRFALNTSIENPDESQKYILGYLPVNNQWNYTLGFNYKHFRKNSFENFVFSRNMLNNVSYKYFNNIEDDSNLILNYLSQESENKFRYERIISNYKGFKISYGGGTELARYTNETYQKLFLNNFLREINYNSRLYLVKYSAFGQISKSYLNDRLPLSFGIRTDGSNYSKSLSNPLKQVSPRISASYVLSEKYSLNSSLGRYFQLPTYTTLGYRDSAGVLVNKQNDLKYISANHFVLGIEYAPSLDSRVTLEGFYKNYNRYPFSVNDSVSLANKGADFGTFGDEEVISTSQGRAFGLELLWKDKNFMGFNVVISYTLVRSEFENGRGEFIPSAWDNIHLLNILANRKFKKNWDFGFKWRFVGGAPYTPYDTVTSSIRSAWDARGRGYLDYSKYNSLRYKPFHQLDIRLDKGYYFKKWSMMLYLDVQNVYNFQSEQQDFLTNLNPDGTVRIDPNNPDRYSLRPIKNESGTVLPSIGIIIEI